MTVFPLTKKTLKNYEADYRIEVIIADGMWYSLPKWRKLARVTEEEINSWVERNMEAGRLVQAEAGAKSFRYPKAAVLAWHKENDLEVGDQILDFIFPARIWDGKTEVEGFLDAPLREIGVVTFECTSAVAAEVTEALKGIARVRESDPGRYKAYSLSADFVKPIIQKIFTKYNVAEAGRIYSRGSSKRREMVDFSDNFSHHLISFYRSFAKSLVKKEMETIKIYIPDPQDQESQIISWVFTAVEKFDETSSVPFSGYLNSVLRRWPYDLPYLHLGRDLSFFQRDRAKALARLRERFATPEGVFAANELATEMGMSSSAFTDLEEKHHVWMKTKNAASLTWEENSEEKAGETVMGAVGATTASKSNALQSHKLADAIVAAALTTEQYSAAFTVISQMGKDELDLTRLQSANPAFVVALGLHLGLIKQDDV